ncbi:MAG TPA: 3-methyl-2-oxobutanoate hydroxymethyltransferase [Chloroflexota bacterium]|nr:3-methyl-2-oxobutanoate hydroxymethyltransferase [Chloroflexota bacterium]
MSDGRQRFVAMKQERRPIVMVTAYDCPTASLEDQADVDVILVGDSVGTNMLGYASEAEVTMADMLHHVRAVRRGVQRAYVLGDMPYQSYATPEDALRNARALLEAGADGVKLEGGEEQLEVVRALRREGIDVCGHVGFTPQTLARPGQKGRVQGKSFERAIRLLRDAEALDGAGIMMLVLELVTEEVAQVITERVTVPTIGIGSGRYCDGQVLVVTDLLGLSPFNHRLSRRYAEWRATAIGAFEQYRDDVQSRRFPAQENVFPANPEDVARLRSELATAES